MIDPRIRLLYYLFLAPELEYMGDVEAVSVWIRHTLNGSYIGQIKGNEKQDLIWSIVKDLVKTRK